MLNYEHIIQQGKLSTEAYFNASIYRYLKSVDSSIAAMTFKGEIIFGRGSIDVLDGHSALHTSQSKSSWSILLVSEDGDAAMLIFEGRLDLLVLLGLAVQLVDDDAPPRRPHHRHRVVHVGTVRPLGQVDTQHRGLGSSVPELDGLVPAAGHQGGVVGSLDPPAGLDWGLVLGHLDRLVGGQVPALDLFVAGGHEHLGPVLVPARVQDGSAHGLLGLGHRGRLGRDLPAPHVVVPGARHQEVVGGHGGRGEGQRGDGVVRWIAHLVIFVGVGHGSCSSGSGPESCVAGRTKGIH